MLQSYYTLCEVLDDDLEMVAKIIHHHQKQKKKVAKIQEHLEMLKIQQYETTINHILDLPMSYIKAFQTIHKGLFQ